MPLQATSGAASYDAFGGGVPVVPVFIEDTFSCTLYTGTGSAQTITNGIDLSGKGGLLWIKNRTTAGVGHALYDTNRGITKELGSNRTSAEYTSTNGITSFLSTGFSLGTDTDVGDVNYYTVPHVSWTFRKQPKFFDVVTYTGTGAALTLAHNLGSTPGCIIVKKTSGVGDWFTWHRSLVASLGNDAYAYLNDTAAATTYAGVFGVPTSTTFTVGADASTSASGATYVAYLFAHDAAGFGLTGTDNVISCGSYTGNGSATGPVINLGYEPQWLMVKASSIAGNWFIIDNMRGMAVGGVDANLKPNSSVAEANESYVDPTATGFNLTSASSAVNSSAETYIYIAIRRGPMKVPTSGTSVFLPSTYTGSNTVNQVINTGFTVDMTLARARNTAVSMEDYDRLRGNTVRLSTDLTDAEVASTALYFDLSNSVSLRAGYNLNYSTLNFVAYNFKRAPSFFDEVCYTGLRAINNTTPQVVSHNLGVAPELVIFKCRSAATISSTATNWATCTILGGVYSNAGYLNTNDSFGFSNNLDPSSNGGVSASSITIGYGAAETNATGNTYVAYLFATCAGVSKVGSYTGTATTKQIDCGFTAGARFVLIKRTDSTGDWYVWDTARGIVSGNDPYLLLNSTAAEVTSTDYVDTYSAGFEISSTAPAAINASGGTYIFLAIA